MRVGAAKARVKGCLTALQVHSARAKQCDVCCVCAAAAAAIGRAAILEVYCTGNAGFLGHSFRQAMEPHTILRGVCCAASRPQHCTTQAAAIVVCLHLDASCAMLFPQPRSRVCGHLLHERQCGSCSDGAAERGSATGGRRLRGSEAVLLGRRRRFHQLCNGVECVSELGRGWPLGSCSRQARQRRCCLGSTFAAMLRKLCAMLLALPRCHDRGAPCAAVQSAAAHGCCFCILTLLLLAMAQQGVAGHQTCLCKRGCTATGSMGCVDEMQL
eukprot:1154291-Pelagomonas_calceolata.AAC.20